MDTEPNMPTTLDLSANVTTEAAVLEHRWLVVLVRLDGEPLADLVVDLDAADDELARPVYSTSVS